MLAYVFWHRAAASDGYEERLAAFHAALRADPPEGFVRSHAFRLDAAPWLAGDGPAYEDWYLVDSWAALGTLNAGAVSAGREAPHDAVARVAAEGSAGIYAPLGRDGVAGRDTSVASAGGTGTRRPPEPPGIAELDVPGPEVAWLAKPAGVAYADFHAALARAATGPVWQRQMTLGPAGEYVAAGLDATWSAVRVRREQIC